MEQTKMFPKIVGSVRCFQMDADRNIIPGTEHKGFNTIQDDMFKFLAKMLCSNNVEVENTDISSDDNMFSNNLYLVNTASITYGGVTYPVGSYFYYTTGSITWGTGKVKRVNMHSVVNLFASSIAGSGSTLEPYIGQDGIAFSQGIDGTGIGGICATELNQGGDGDKTFIEFYGEFYNNTASSKTVGSHMVLGTNLKYNVTDWLFVNTLAIYDYSTNVQAGRRFGFYWRFDFGESV